MINKTLKILVVQLCFIATFPDQSIGQDKAQYEAKLLKTLERMQEYSMPQGNDIYHLHFSALFVPNANKYSDFDLESKKMEVKLWVGGPKLYYYESDYLAIYKDAREIFTVVHPQKQIVWKKTKPESAKTQTQQAQVQALKGFQKELITSSMVTSHRDSTWAGKPIKIIQLTPNPEARKKTNIKYLRYYYDPHADFIHRQIIVHTSDYKLKKQVITYHKMEMHYQGQIPSTARAQLFSAENRLSQKYQGYQIEKY